MTFKYICDIVYPFSKENNCPRKKYISNINNAIAKFSKAYLLYNCTSCSIYDVQQRLAHHVPNSTPSTITKYTSTFKCNVTSSATMGTPRANDTSCTHKWHTKCQQYTKYSTKLRHFSSPTHNTKGYSLHRSFPSHVQVLCLCSCVQRKSNQMVLQPERPQYAHLGLAG